MGGNQYRTMERKKSRKTIFFTKKVLDIVVICPFVASSPVVITRGETVIKCTTIFQFPSSVALLCSYYSMLCMNLMFTRHKLKFFTYLTLILKLTYQYDDICTPKITLPLIQLSVMSFIQRTKFFFLTVLFLQKTWTDRADWRVRTKLYSIDFTSSTAKQVGFLLAQIVPEVNQTAGHIV